MQTQAITIAIVAVAASVFGKHRILDTKQVAKTSLAEDVHSLSDMLTVFNETEKMYEALKELIKIIKSEGETIRDDVEKFMQHPLNQLRFMNRYAEKWRALKALLQRILSNRDRLNRLKPKHNLQQEESSGRNFLLDLIDVYGLDVRNFSRDLTPDDCYAIGKKSHETGKYSLCADWMEQALRKITQGEKAAYTVDAVSKGVLICNGLRDKPDTPSTELYKKLCRRESTQPREGQSNLKCYQTHGDSAWPCSDPVRIEVLSKEPDILLYHDLIPRSDVEQMRDLVTKALNLTGAKSYDFRLPDTASGEGGMMNRNRVRIAGVESVPIDKVQSLKVKQNKRRFSSSFSPYVPINNDFGFMLFMSDVERGGAVVFEAPAVNVLPNSGDALVWQKGLKMASCPVLIGDKWTAQLRAKPVQRYKFKN